MSPLDYASSSQGVFELVSKNRKVDFLVKNSKIPGRFSPKNEG